MYVMKSSTTQKIIAGLACIMTFFCVSDGLTESSKITADQDIFAVDELEVITIDRRDALEIFSHDLEVDIDEKDEDEPEVESFIINLDEVLEISREAEGKDDIDYYAFTEEFDELFRRIGEDTKLVELFLTGRYVSVIDGIWTILQDPQYQDYADDLLLLLAESYYRLGEEQQKIKHRSLSIFKFGMNRFPKSPNDLIRLVRLGVLEYQQGYLPEAEGYFSSFEDSYPQHQALGQVLTDLADCYREDDSWKQATLAYRRAYEHTKSPARRRLIGLGMAQTLFLMEKPQDAVRIYDQVITDSSLLTEFTVDDLNSYGHSQFQAKNYEKAGDAFVLLAEAHPDSPYRAGALYRLGMIDLKNDMTEQAVERFSEVREKYLHTEEYYLASIRLADLRLKGDPPDQKAALTLLEECIAQDDYEQPQLEAYYLTAKMLKHDGDYLGSMKNLSLVLEWVRDNPFLRPALNLIQESFSELVLNNFAERQYQTIVKAFDEYEENLINNLLSQKTLDLLGQSLMAKYEYEKARVLFSNKHVVRKHKDLAEFYIALAQFRENEPGVLPQRLREFSQSKAEANLRARALLALGDRLAQEGDPEAAMADYRQGIDLKPDDEWQARLFLRVADYELAASKIGAALSHYLAIQRMNLKYPELMTGPNVDFGLAECWYRLNKYSPALVGFEQFKKRYPEDSRRGLVRVRIAQCMVKTGSTVAEAVKTLTADEGESAETKAMLAAIAQDMSWWTAPENKEKN